MGIVCSVAVVFVAGLRSLAGPGQGEVAAPPQRVYEPTNLTSNGSTEATNTDPQLLHPWGLAFEATGIARVANNGNGLSTAYNELGVAQLPDITIPGPVGSQLPSHPTGVVFNSGLGFEVSMGVVSGASVLIFATQEGTISGWNPLVNNAAAIRMVDKSGLDASYTGLAIAGTGSGATMLYVADFHNGRIDVFDTDFAETTVSGDFIDLKLPAGFSPYGIANIGGVLYVTYAMRDPSGEVITGAGLGIVNVFDVDGVHLERVKARGQLDAPWGIALAPSDFGEVSGMLLIANTGDGKINAFDRLSGAFRGVLRAADNRPIEIDGLRAIGFGSGDAEGLGRDLFFTAGPMFESAGVLGKIELTGQ
jgi:uncharacterized protein (TIGR03118 family)